MKLLKSRLTLLGLALGLLVLATNAFIHRSIVRSGQAVTGAKIEVGRIRTSWRSARIELDHVQAADPQRSMRNLFEADRIVLDLDPGAILHRRFVVNRGQVHGIRVGTRRSTPGALDSDHETLAKETAVPSFGDEGMRWFDEVTHALQQDIGTPATSREFADKMQTKWPTQCSALVAEAVALQKRLASTERSITQAGDNPLRNLTSYQSAVGSLDTFTKELFEIRGKIDRQQQQLLMEHEQLQAAVKSDEVLMQLQHELPALDGESLGKYLLADEISTDVRSVVEWLRWGRQFIPALYTHSVPGAGRGQNVIFGGCKPQPNILLKTMVLSGCGDVEGDRFTLEGTVTNLSSNPAINEHPTELVVQTTGSVQTAIHAVMDSRGEHSKDRIYIKCPRWIQPERQWGNPEHLSFIASGGESQLSILLDVTDHSQLSGEISMRQMAIRLTPRLNDRLTVQPIPTLLAEAAQKVERLDVSVKISGSLEFPKWELRSNFGTQLAKHLHETFQKAVVEQHAQAMAQQRQATTSAVEQLVQSVTNEHQQIAKQLEGGDDRLQSIHAHIAERVRQNDGVVQPNSPLREVYRR